LCECVWGVGGVFVWGVFVLNVSVFYCVLKFI